MENPMSLPPVFAARRSTTTSCRRRCASSSAARPSRPSRSRRCRPTDGWRSSRPTIRRCCRSAGSDRGTCCTCRRAPFTEHEVRLARAIGTVLAARYRAIFDPETDARARRAVSRRDRGPLHRRVSRRRGAGIRRRPRADLVATAIEVLRVAALSSYENRAISSGVLLLGGTIRPCGASAVDQAVSATRRR